MPRPVTGRRPDSLFDNRYRYDYIYPRGRSGETLRAYDTLRNNQPVVIKRPAPQDAPPMRAGQEVSLQNEKRALELLAGHPVLCELLHAGTFRVGGQAHMYLAIEMAQGETLESMVLEAASRAARLPELETLNIIEGLLDLLQAAHDHRLVYNDVDAKHLFWDRENYVLKMIDWGNAVFLNAEHVPTHVTRQSDLAQTGELMYFVFSGGGRLESGRLDPGSDLPQDVDGRLKAIINRAVHPELSQRYADAASMRRDLAEVRRPLHKDRESLVERVRGRMPSSSSQNQLEELRGLAIEALAVDPGYPPARALLAEIDTRLHQLAMQSDLDAVRIYIESGNLARAEALLDDLTTREDALTMPLLLFLQDTCSQISLTNTGDGGTPLLAEGLAPALAALFKNDAHAAARALLSTPDNRPTARLQQMLLAERLTQRTPGVVLLRPHLVRLEDMLARTPGAASSASATRLLGGVRTLLRKLEDPIAPGLRPLLGLYQHVADILVGLEDDLQASSTDESRPGDTPIMVAARARQAADSIVELLEVTASNALADPSRAGAALWNAASIDPVQPAFESINNRLTAFHADLDELRKFMPAADGANIADFLTAARKQLRPYAGEVTDPHYEAIMQGVESAAANWAHLGDAIALGGRRPALDACRLAAEGARPLNKALAAWFDDMLRRIEETPRTELLSPNATLGRALAEGWEAWDRGRGQEAMLAAKRAADAAITEAEKLAARRLIGLGETLDKWLEREGPTSLAQTEATERRILTLFLPEEEQIRATFAAQMPTLQIYLKAMGRGVVEPLREASAAGVRVLFFDYVLRGMRALQKEQFDEAAIWQDAAGKALPNARLHPAFQMLENNIVRRQLVLEAVRVLNNTRSIAGLPEARQAVRAPLASGQLEQADQALRAVDESLRRWQDGDFRGARQQLDTALERINATQGITGKDLSPFRLWLQDMADSAEILAQAKRVIEQAALVPADEPDPAIEEAHQKLVDLTRRDLGEAYTPQLRQWRDTYVAIRDVYASTDFLPDDKLRLLDGHFASLFIDRQPALPIFRHWQEIVRQTPMPEPDSAPITYSVETLEGGPALPPFLAGTSARPAPAPRGAPAPSLQPEAAESAEPAEEPDAGPRAESSRRSRAPMVLLLALVVLVALVVLAAVILGGGQQGGGPVATPVRDLTAAALNPGAGLAGGSPTETLPPTHTLNPPTATATPVPPTSTIPPSATPVPPTVQASETPEGPVPTPTLVTAIPTGELLDPATLAPLYTPTITPLPTLNAGAVLLGTPLPDPIEALPTLPPPAESGQRDLLAALDTLAPDKISWDTAWFEKRDGIWQLGNPSTGTGRGPLIRLGPDILTPLFGADAARFVRRAEVTFELRDYAGGLLPTGQVFFGVGFESLQGQRAAIEAKLIQPQVLDVGVYLNARSISGVQIPAPDMRLRLAIERNEDGTLSLYLNDDQLLGRSNAAYPPGVPLKLYLYASTGGVLVDVTSLDVELEQGE